MGDSFMGLTSVGDWVVGEESLAKAPGVAVADVVDPTLDGCGEFVEGDGAGSVCMEQVGETPAVLDALASFEPAMGRVDDEA